LEGAEKAEKGIQKNITARLKLVTTPEQFFQVRLTQMQGSEPSSLVRM
jgi:hypothetical protein